MDFQVGDRVVSVKSDYPGLEKGEYGKVVDFDYCGEPIVKWDNYNPERHDSDGMVRSGHGWFINKTYIQLIKPDDLGELPEIECGSIDKFLFE